MRVQYIDDLHCHLRQGDLMKKVVKYIRKGGCNRVLVMPNTIPEITSCKQALEYRNQLIEIEPRVDYLMTLYLSDKISIKDLQENYKSCHIQGVKCYPANVTTNSSSGFKSLEDYYELFSAMEKLQLSLHIHGEDPNSNPLKAEENFLINIENVCRRFPDLKVVAEHITTRAALDLVYRIHNLGATITPHHMLITVNDVLSDTYDVKDNILNHIKNPFNYCKPLAKTNDDLLSIKEAIKNLHPRLFLGSDSAPHYIVDKESKKPPAGIFTQPYLFNYLVTIFTDYNCMDKLEQFTTINGTAFLQLEKKDEEYFNLKQHAFNIPLELDGIKPFMAGSELKYIIDRGD